MARRSQAHIALESIEQQMTTLAEMIEDNKAKQEEIKSLRDGVSIRPASSWNLTDSLSYSTHQPSAKHRQP